MNNYNMRKIDHWLTKAADHEIVLVIGAGFTKNAMLSDMRSTASSSIPLWDDIISTIQNELDLVSFDSLLSFDIYRESLGMRKYETLLLNSMPDSNLEPGEVHTHLTRIPRVKAIITTNNIDTLLDKTYPDAYKVINDSDVAGAPDNKLQIIYLHGHRSNPDSWVFSRTDYEDINEKYPLKISICRNLLAAYPSLFIGFGHADPDLHSIMRFVNKAVNVYKPPMLSLTIDPINDRLCEYWMAIGLSISAIHEGSEKLISEDILESLDYIINKRLEKLKKEGKLSLGYRQGESFMDVLMKHKFECRYRRDDLILCDYHISRGETEIFRLQEPTGIIAVSAYTTMLKPNSNTADLIKKMLDGYAPAGGWGLMPSHRKWLKYGIVTYAKAKKHKNVLITGIAGLPHFVDIVSLMFECIDDDEFLNLSIIDICDGPLVAINNFVENNIYVYHETDHELYEKVLALIKSKRIQVNLINGDIFNAALLPHNNFDIILSHHLISEWGLESRNKTEKYAEVIHSLLYIDGILISAQNIAPEESKVIAFQELMRKKSFKILDTLSVFDVYDFDGTLLEVSELELSDMPIFVDNKTLLSIHRKEE